MSVLEKVKKTFLEMDLPSFLKREIEKSDCIQDLILKIEESMDCNSANSEQIYEKIRIEDDLIEEYKSIIKTESYSSDFEKTNILKSIKRKCKVLASLERRQKIYEENIDLSLSVLDKIREIEAAESKPLTREQIENIAVDHEEAMEAHRDVVNTVKSISSSYDYDSDEEELKKLEREILGEIEKKSEITDISRLLEETDNFDFEKKELLEE